MGHCHDCRCDYRGGFCEYFSPVENDGKRKSGFQSVYVYSLMAA